MNFNFFIFIKKSIPIMIGSALYAFGVHFFIIPNELMEGGITGISLLLHYVLAVPPALTTIVLNIPLFYAGWKQFGSEAILYTIVGTSFFSLFLWLFEYFIEFGWITPFQTTDDIFLAILYAGVITGLGLGIVFRAGGTTGGSDIVARIGHKKIGWSVGRVLLTVDTIIIGSAIFFLPLNKILYTLVVVFIATRTVDFIQEGAFSTKSFAIITDQPEKISLDVMDQMNHGVTIFEATGGYSGMNKNVLYCIVYRNEVQKLKTLVRQHDPSALMIIHDVHDVLGEGFKPE